MDKPLAPQSAIWMTQQNCSLDDFKSTVEQTTDAGSYPLAESIQSNIPIYDAAKIRDAADNSSQIAEYMAEWNDAFLEGPGIVVFRRAYEDTALIDDVTAVLKSIIAREREANGGKGDHFGKPGDNARVWNAHEKLCIAAPELYARYNANDILSLASRSWLGPLYQITAQVNLVYPGGAAQSPHRDYHMGFQTPEQLAQYPAHVHRLSAALSLQGGIAHCDMPIESGPTKLLPYSQTYLPGYFATHRPEFRDYFEAHHVQLPLKKGDVLFFNPAVFHAAGTNRSADIQRLVNLLQINSAYGRPIEIADRARMTIAAYATIRAMGKSGDLNAREIENVIAATAEGYPFPADLDINSPLTGMAPQSQQEILREALASDWEQSRLNEAIEGYVFRRSPARHGSEA